MPNPNLKSQLIALSPGGLAASRAIPDQSSFRKLSNIVNFRGRWAIRPGVTAAASLLDIQTTPAAATQINVVADMGGKLWVVGIGKEADDSTTSTLLWRLSKGATGGFTVDTAWATGGKNAEVVWSGYSAGTPIATPVQGPRSTLTTAAEYRLYICDYQQSASAKTKYYAYRSPHGGTDALVTMSEELIDDVAAGTDVFFSNMLEYQYHVWGVGFRHDDGTNNVLDPAILRFSTPGLLQLDEPEVANPPATAEWWVSDWRGIGNRHDAITALGKAGGGLVVAKRRAAYLIQGFDRYSWGLEQLSGSIGAVGPYAIDWIEDGLCFMWSEVGPVMTDGNKVYQIGEDIRDKIQLTKYAQSAAVAVSPDDSLVYFSLDLGTGTVNEWAAFDYQREKWCDGSWLKGVSTKLPINSMFRVTTDALPGVSNDPSGFTATAQDEDEILLEWTNGETGIGTTTEIYYCTGGSCDPTTGTKVDEVGAGVDQYTHDGLTSRTIHNYAIRHKRNGQTGSWVTSGEVKTFLADVSNVVPGAYATGITVTWVNNEAGAGASTFATIQRRNVTDSGSWETATSGSVLITALTWNDTGCDCGDEYEYRIKVTEAGYTDSDYVASAISQEACATPPSITSVVQLVTVVAGCTGLCNWSISYRAANAEEGDTVKYYVSHQVSPAYSWVLVKTEAASGYGGIEGEHEYKSGSAETRRFAAKVEIYEAGSGTPADTGTDEDDIAVSAVPCPLGGCSGDF